ncbi:protein kinase [Kitasatospora sp. NPDC093806]|uniref:serine/threonine protein kinase n=1 Tax=Kitasatospora sp. NPDC093806 TaxID=3155075 RepID=UPI0034167A67
MRGTTLGDRYRLDEWLGGGSMGDVWLAEDQVLDRRVAVKLLKPALLDEPGFAERFHDEARVMARLQHPGIVGVYDFGPGRTAGDVPSWAAAPDPATRPVAYLVMELIDGEPLSAVLERRGRLTVPESLDLTLEALAALQTAHEAGIVHRDVKPANMMVRDGHVVITDFGIARPGCDPRHTVPGMVLGTAAYQAPEQASTNTVTASADLYALGVVLYECLSGRLPFEGETALELILKHLTDPVPPLPEDVPAPVRALVERAMAKDPALRWPDAATMAAAVRAALAGQPIVGPAAGVAAAAVLRSSGAMAALRSTGTTELPRVSPAALLAAGSATGSMAGSVTGSAMGSAMGSAVAPAVAGTAGDRPRRTARLRSALFGSRRRTVLVVAAAVLCCTLTASAAVVLHRDEEPTGALAAGGGAPVASVQPGLPPTIAAGLVPDPGAPSPSPSPGAPTPSGPPVAPDAPGATVPGAPGAAVPGAGGGPVGRDATAPNGSVSVPGAPAPGAPAAGGPGSAAGSAGGSPAGSPAGSSAAGTPGGSAGTSPERPSPPAEPAYTAAPPPDPAYTANPRRTVPPDTTAPVYTPAPTYTNTPVYTVPPKPVYTPPAPYTPPPGQPTDPPIKPPTFQTGPLPTLARLSNAGSVLYDQDALDRDGNPVVTTPTGGGPGSVWQLTPNGSDGYSLANGAARYGKFLELDGTSAQTRLTAALPSGPNQVWSFIPVSGGYLVTVARSTNRCLSAAGLGLPATVRACAASADQIWTVTAA